MKKTAWILVVIMTIAIFFRFFDIAKIPPGLYPDEAMNGNNALEAIATDNFKIFYPENNGREGLFINIQALFVKAVGQNEPWVLRLPSALFGIFTVLGIFFLARELFRRSINIKAETIALLAAFFLAISFWHINFSRIGFRAIMAPFFAIWSVYFLLKAFGKEKYLWTSIWGGIFFGLGFYSYIAYRALPALIFIIFLLFWFLNKDKITRKKILLSTFYFLFSAIVVALPLGIYFLNNPADFLGRTAQISIFSSSSPIKDLAINVLKTAGMFNIAGDWNWRHNIAGAPLLYWPVGILFLIGLIFGFKKIYRLPHLTALSWLVVATLPVIISNEGLPHALRSILIVPPVFVLAGLGGFQIYEWLIKTTLPRKMLIAGCYLLFVLLVLNAYYSYFVVWVKNPEVAGAFAKNYAEMGREINNLPKELPKYVIVAASGADVRGLPMPAQTIMFLTDSFRPEMQKEKNIHYILPTQIDQIIQGSAIFTLE